MDIIRFIDVVLTFLTNSILLIINGLICMIDLLKSVDNPMFRIVLAFVPGLLGLSYPIIVQTIGKLNDQYKSTHIIKHFLKEKLHRLFIIFLIISVILVLSSFILSYLIFVFAFISVVLLITVYFLYINLIISYQSGESLFLIFSNRLQLVHSNSKKINIESSKELINILFKNDNKKEPKFKVLENIFFVKVINYIKKNYIKHKEIKKYNLLLEAWHPLIDLFIYAIINKNKKLEDDIRNIYIYQVIGFIQNSYQKDEDIHYPNEIYNRTYDIIYSYLKNYDTGYYQNFEYFIGSIFFGNSLKFNTQFLHQDSLISIWKNLVLLIEYKRNDKLLSYWANAHQYFRFKFDIIKREYDNEFLETENSINLQTKVQKHRNAFIQIHTVLGSYLMYKGDYKTLKNIWYFTQSQPPEYVLFPQSIDKILKCYFTFLNFQVFDPEIIFYYWFTDLSFDEMNNKIDVKSVVCQYTALLFLRHYVVQGLSRINFQTFPEIPISQSEKKEWINKLDEFKAIVNSHFKNENLMKELGLDIITEDWCKNRNLIYPIDYIDNLKIKIQNDFESELAKAPLDSDLLSKLKEKTVNSILIAYNNIHRISNNIQCNFKPMFIRGDKFLFNKEAFIKNSSVFHINADEVFGESIKIKYYERISMLFYLNKNRNFIVDNGCFFDAIDKLQLDSYNYVIICFGVNLDYYKDFRNIKIDKGKDEIDFIYNSIPIYCFYHYHPFVYNSIFILKREDLPLHKHLDTSKIKLRKKDFEYWNNFGQPINDLLFIYFKITDFNKNDELRNSYILNGYNEIELKDKLEINFDFLGEMGFKENVNIIEIKENEKFQEGGINNINDIKKFENNF